MNRVLAIVVLYHPDETKLKCLLESIDTQVSEICLVDNTEEDKSGLITELSRDSKANLHHVILGDNYGIAYAQNRGVEYAQSKGYEFVLLLDQDSCLPENSVDDLLDGFDELTKAGQAVACIGPSFIDLNSKRQHGASETGLLSMNPVNSIQDEDIVKSEHIIASGALIPLSVLESIGNMREELFIDWVDIEWCHRASHYGYSTYVHNGIKMTHHLGDKIHSLFGIKFNAHSDIRQYYIIRNAIALLRSPFITNKFRIFLLARALSYTVLYTLTAKEKRKSFKLYTKALYHGLKNNLGKYKITP